MNDRRRLARKIRRKRCAAWFLLDPVAITYMSRFTAFPVHVHIDLYLRRINFNGTKDDNNGSTKA